MNNSIILSLRSNNRVTSVGSKKTIITIDLVDGRYEISNNSFGTAYARQLVEAVKIMQDYYKNNNEIIIKLI